MDYYDILQSLSLMPVVDAMMRVPPLFLIDELLRVGFGPPVANETMDIFEKSLELAYKQTFIEHVYFYYLLWILKFFFMLNVFVGALCIFIMMTKHLITLYVYSLSLAAVFVGYWANTTMINIVLSYAEQENAATILENIMTLDFAQVLLYKPGFAIVQNLLLQTTLGLYFYYSHFGYISSYLQNIILWSFLLPSIITVHHKVTFLQHTPVIASLLQLVICKSVLWSNIAAIIKLVDRGISYIHTFIRNYGLTALIETEWNRLNVPRVLRVFWMLRMAEQMVHILNSQESNANFGYYDTLRTLLVNGCETLTALLGMTSVVSFICHYIGCFFQWVLLTDDGDEKSFGTISAVLFYILALQTGLTGLDHEKRFVRLCKNFCLLSTAVLHFVHNNVNPLLMSLSASHNPALHRHLRALAVCGFLIIFASTLLGFLWTHFTISTWLLAVSVFSIEVIVKVLVSLAIYSLFLFVAYRSTFWEQLDDCVYFIRSFGNTVEFAFGIVLFFNGSWILMFESGGAIRAVMMCIHAYFNLWCEARAGWNVFMKRRSAVKKINSLPEAKAEQLHRHDDVCAICYQEMCHAKITRCNHFFHAVCLRKWLYVQDRCPLCHDILYKVETTDEKQWSSRNDEQPPQEQQAQPAEGQVEGWFTNR